MLKLRLKRGGRKRLPSYRLILIQSNSKREGKPIESLGFYKPISKEFRINPYRVKLRLKQGAKPTETVTHLLKKAGISV